MFISMKGTSHSWQVYIASIIRGMIMHTYHGVETDPEVKIQKTAVMYYNTTSEIHNWKPVCHGTFQFADNPKKVPTSTLLLDIVPLY